MTMTPKATEEPAKTIKTIPILNADFSTSVTLSIEFKTSLSIFFLEVYIYITCYNYNCTLVHTLFSSDRLLFSFSYSYLSCSAFSFLALLLAPVYAYATPRPLFTAIIYPHQTSFTIDISLYIYTCISSYNLFPILFRLWLCFVWREVLSRALNLRSLSLYSPFSTP